MKKITFVCLTAMMMTVLSTFSLPVAVQARTMSEGTLKWDFESSDDIGYYSANDTASKVYVAQNSGAWVRESMPSPSQSWQFRVEPAAHSSITGVTALENGGDNCLQIRHFANLPVDSSKYTYNYAASGVSVLLSDTELIPGMSYTISFDILGASANHDKACVAFSKPSAYGTVSDTTAVNDKLPWKKAGMGEIITLTTDINNGPINTQWTKQSGTFTAPSQYYENGFIRLHITTVNAEDGQMVRNGEVYIDNVEISPAQKVTDKVVYSKVNAGKTWDFEEGVDNEKNGQLDANNYVGKYEDGAWAGLDDRLKGGVNVSFIPKYMPVGSISLKRTTGDTTDYGKHGEPAPGSSECIGIPSPSNAGSDSFVLGTRIKLSKADFPAGTYSLNFYAVSQINYPKALSNQPVRNIYASVFKGDFNVNVMKYGSPAVGITTEQISQKFATAKHTADMGMLGNGWGRYNAEFTLTDDDYDENGYFTLVLHVNNTGFTRTLYAGEAIYLDDISLTRTDGTFPDGNVNLSVTSVSHSKLENTMTVAAVYADANLSALTGSDCEIGDINGVEHTQLKVNVPSGSTFKLFQFNANTLAPYLEIPFVK